MDAVSTSPRDAPGDRKGCLRPGCLVPLLVLTVVVIGWVGLRLTLPSRLAARTHDRIRPGSSLRDVLSAAEWYWDANGSQCGGGIDSFRVFTAGAPSSGSFFIRRVGSKSYDDRVEVRFATKADLLRLVDERPVLQTCRRLGFTFLVTGVPPRTSFTVELDENGRVTRVGQPRTWD